MTAIAALMLIGYATPAASATRTAASCSNTDVRAAVASAANGDTVVVPAGNCAWSSGLGISIAITLSGADGQTVITNNYTGGSLIDLFESPNGNLRLQGFTFVKGTGPLQGNPDFMVKVSFVSNGKPVLITGNRFLLGGNSNALGFFTNRGVIWANAFTGTPSGGACLNNSSALRHKHAIMSSWTTPAAWGATDTNGDGNVYFENNTLTDVLEGVDVDDNARTILRYNRVTNSAFVHHGNDTSGTGARYSEIYQNTFVWDTSVKCGTDLPTNVNTFIALRGGTSLIWNNVIPDISGQAWGNKPEVIMLAENLRRYGGPFPCYTGGYAIPHQVGWGFTSGGTRAGSTSIFQDREPVYLWGNTGTGNYQNPAIYDYGCTSQDSCDYPNTLACQSRASASSYIVSGRDYFLNTPRPGYTPYTYPHPLTTSSGGSSSSPPPAAALPSPTNLQVR